MTSKLFPFLLKLILLTIILGALSLILGQRADNKSIKIDAEKCIIEAEFDISGYHYLNDFFLQNDLDNVDNHCLILSDHNKFFVRGCLGGEETSEGERATF